MRPMLERSSKDVSSLVVSAWMRCFGQTPRKYRSRLLNLQGGQIVAQSHNGKTVLVRSRKSLVAVVDLFH